MPYVYLYRPGTAMGQRMTHQSESHLEEHTLYALAAARAHGIASPGDTLSLETRLGKRINSRDLVTLASYTRRRGFDPAKPHRDDCSSQPRCDCDVFVTMES